MNPVVTTLGEIVEFAERDFEGFSAWFDRLPPDERRMIVRAVEQAAAIAASASAMVRLMEEGTVAERARWH